MRMPLLLTYDGQVRWLKARLSLCRRIGTWQKGANVGDMWAGEGFGYRWWFDTHGRHLVAGSFRARPLPRKSED